MFNKIKVAFVSLVMLTAGSSLLPVAQASDQDKETIVTFSEPVEIPGQVLLAGKYMFKLADIGSDPNIVQIFAQEEGLLRLVATEMCIPTYRSNPTEEPLFTLEERPAGAPEAVGSWFYAGSTDGLEFVYPKPKQESSPLAKAEPEILAAPPTINLATVLPPLPIGGVSILFVATPALPPPAL